jgi:hypothetical protein
MRTSTAYFAGVGTVMAAVVAGLGGGLVISSIVSPHAPRTEMSKLELRMSERPIPATNASSEPAPPATSPPPAAAPVTQAATSEPIKSPEAAFARASDADLKARDGDVKSRDGDVKPRADDVKSRDGDVRREARRATEEKRAEEKRKAERRQQWAERRRHPQRPDQDLRDVEAKVREDTEPRQVFAAEPVKLEMPRIRLFEAE